MVGFLVGFDGSSIGQFILLPSISNPNLHCSRCPAQSIGARSSETLDGKKGFAIIVVRELKIVWIMVLVEAPFAVK